MSTPIHAQLSSTFVSTGAIANISLPSGYDRFDMWNVTDVGSSTNTSVMTATGLSLIPGGAYYSVGSGSSSVLTEKFTNANGFTFVADSALAVPGSLISISGISAAAPAVASTSTTTGLYAGSIVRIIDPVGLLQIGGLDFTVGTVSAGSSFTLAYLDTTLTNLSGGASSASYRIIPYNPRFYPSRRTITNIESSGVNTIITLSVTHGYTVGQQVRLYCPSAFGMTQLNGLQGTIIAIGATDASGFTNTITVNINSSGFTAFGWPTSAAAGTGTQFAFVVPFGEAATTSAGSVNPANLLDDATTNISFTGVQIGTSVQTSGKTYQWIATKGVSY